MFRTFQHPQTGRLKEVKVGFCWTIMFFGIIPMFCRGDLKSAFSTLAIAWIIAYFLPITISWLVVWALYFIIAMKYNNYYANQLIQKGYNQIN